MSSAAQPCTDWPLLQAVSSLADLRHLPIERLPELAAQIRAFLVAKVTAHGGHLGPNLGVVELTMAVHRVFDRPEDTVLFDTGHQSYVHKVLTGRAGGFDRLREAGGLSGYPSRGESGHDVIENSHASTALSYADGLAKAQRLRNRTAGRVVAVVGDGALTGGLALEALNNLGHTPQLPVVVVLNDNGRSYAPTVGGLAAHLTALRTGRSDPAHNVFTELGLAYLGPVDGHDVVALENALRRARDLGTAVVVHTVTVKGKGCEPAEQDAADRLHAVGIVDPVTCRPTAPVPRSWTSVFSEALVEIGRERQDVVAVTAAMAGPTGLAAFAEAHPQRMFDVGIAEQHAVASAAGLALAGMHPVVAVYATFLGRAIDQVLMDVALHRLPVTFVLDRAGVTGPDGPSHHGMWDASLLSVVPGLRLAVPRDTVTLRSLLREAVAWDRGPTALRFPKASADPPLPAVATEDGIDVLTSSGGPDVLLVSFGPLAGECVRAAAMLERRGVGVTVADPRWALPVPPALVELAGRHQTVVTVEDNSRTSGLGAALAQLCADRKVPAAVHTLGLPRRFLPHGSRADLLTWAGLDAAGITRAVVRARQRTFLSLRDESLS
ncbi:1-deoxy-D-xylulose-5-phosphate synthase [Streptomyces minutiscleroticus]|uniref:1-deoxy-D-xylulose-5-phosphate synthase n=1 Tax=Streptomyces minutiscleroticus TaxID=68238 RepID=A0A918NZT0_9ACTN|nr:1-deoxy-D-xylulose-5-phosphate synthase [Streptomyces minutiscleroticus]GGY09838.1 1-deoxy-D-xylulose-5-phosphate synthase [Streptomyces minutiscleroticus]